ncbi:MAG: hypothetical protein ACPLRR_03770 [Candidatus Saccharicenans sp.]
MNVAIKKKGLYSCFLAILIFLNLGAQTFSEERVRETTHFIIVTYENNLQYLEEIISSLEENYERILTLLEMEEKIPKIVVRIYPTIKDFHQACNMVGAPTWAVGTAWGKSEFRMVSPLCPDLSISYQVMTHKLPVHELTHVMVSNIVNPASIPYWLWEGIALYMAGQSVNLALLTHLKEGKFPDFKDLNRLEYTFQFGYSLVEFIIERWGIFHLRSLLLAYGNIEKAMGISPESFYEKWKEFVKQKYF